ncbi:2-acylglycerol O-acyltransferase 2 isoform X2 [Hypanus sabinus]|uniref:2-acylglycerol O-acyltransferase 2 isoform X2 n=1 Tax=Hypanus sabinus TaxID=79690 RepID=UPI0028C4DCC6|nr:2-acylglycerol O-acyltransferase 2 isoform X2 [Hypanus sabinus]
MCIDFAPLRIPLRRRLQTLVVLQWVFSFLCLAQCCAVLFVTLFFTRFWFVSVLYATWWFWDRNTPYQGGRRFTYLRSLRLWGYFRDYFPIHLVKTADLDPKKNYIFGFHPHGVLVAGAFGNFCTELTGFQTMFPGLKPHMLMLSLWFRVPFFRDYIMTGGLVPSDKESAKYLLRRKEGGNVAIIAIGGAPEALDARPGAFTLQLKERKGFIKLALQFGAPLVPVFSFGENEVFDQVKNPKGSFLRRVQERLQKLMGVSLPLFHARGVFQYSFGLIPYRKPIYTVVGRPIEVERRENPTQKDIDALHQKYIEELSKLFEEHKTHYKVSEDKHLTFT